MAFKYRGRTKQQVEQRQITGGRDFDPLFLRNIKTYSVKDGNNTIRILPPPVAYNKNDHFGFDVYIHYQVGPENGQYLCPRQMSKKELPCPICEERARAEAEGDKEYADKLKPTRRVAYYLVDRNPEEGKDQELYIWAAPASKVDEAIVNLTDDPEEGLLLVDDPDTGYDIHIKKNGKGLNTTYGVSIARSSSSLGRSGGNWLEFVEQNPIPDVLNICSYEYLAKVFHGKVSEDTSNGDDGEDESVNDEPPFDSTDEPVKSKSKEKGPDITWREVHRMSPSALDSFVQEQGLEIDPNDFESDNDYADEICNQLGIANDRASRSSRLDRVG